MQCAITNAFKKTEEEFITIYEVKIKCQIREATCGGVIWNILLDFMETKKE